MITTILIICLIFLILRVLYLEYAITKVQDENDGLWIAIERIKTVVNECKQKEFDQILDEEVGE